MTELNQNLGKEEFHMDSNKTFSSNQETTKVRTLSKGVKNMCKKEQLEKLGWFILDGEDQSYMTAHGGESYLEMRKSALGGYRAYHEERDIYWGHVGVKCESEYIDMLWEFERAFFGDSRKTAEGNPLGVWESARGKSVADFEGYRSFLGKEEKNPRIGFATSYVNHTLKVVLSEHLETPCAVQCKKHIEGLFSEKDVSKPKTNVSEGFMVEEFSLGLDYYTIEKLKPQWLNFLFFKNGEITGSLKDDGALSDIYRIDFQYQVVFPKMVDFPSKQEVFEARNDYLELKQEEVIYPTVDTKTDEKVVLTGVEEPKGIRAFIFPIGENTELGLTLVGKESVVSGDEDGQVFAINTLSKQAYVRSCDSYYDKEESTWEYGILIQAEKNIFGELEETQC